MTAVFTPDQLADRMLQRRAVEAVVWGMPVVNFDLMFQEMVRLGGDWNQIVWWPGLLDWKNQTLTPNPDVIYLMPFFNTEAGPVVFEVPPADDGVLNGSVMDRWQAAIEDIGPGGVDKGKGGKYLVLPPGFAMEHVPKGYIPMPSYTYRGYALVRSVLKSGSDEDLATAIAYSKRLKVYPLSAAGDPPESTYVDASGEVFDSTIPYNMRFFESLARMVAAEPWLERDRAMIDPLKTIGIERGKAFSPNARTIAILEDAIAEAHGWIETLYGATPPYYPGKRWFFPATDEFSKSVLANFRVPDSYPTDNRANNYSLAFFSAKHIGESQYYLLVGHDRDGKPFDGDATYRLNVPAGVPVKQYWSITAYDRETHAFIRETLRQGRSSQSPGLAVNADGSVDLYFGPAAPSGQDANWVPTRPGRGFELLARFYGPEPALFQKSWQLGDVERTV